jgi:protein-L-isoaspartate(D-aspartate) O-methyltransferase
MVAIMNEELRLDVGHKVLEVGAGSGYHAATVAEIVAPRDVDRGSWGHVYTTEIIPELVAFARRNLERTGYSDRVTVIHSDGSEGYTKEAPYDRILVTASAPDVPMPLVDQLKPGGLLLIPIGGSLLSQDLVLVKKSADGKLERRRVCGVAFVLLRGKHGWRYV